MTRHRISTRYDKVGKRRMSRAILGFDILQLPDFSIVTSGDNPAKISVYAAWIGVYVMKG
jgi:hypothetical protein